MFELEIILSINGNLSQDLPLAFLIKSTASFSFGAFPAQGGKRKACVKKETKNKKHTHTKRKKKEKKKDNANMTNSSSRNTT